jgi:hypothetical protein
MSIQTVRILVEVKADAKLRPNKVAKLVQRLIDAGLQEAQDSSRISDFDDAEVDEILCLDIKKPKVIQ